MNHRQDADATKITGKMPVLRGRMIVPLFCAALFLGSCLLFAIEPMFTKMILPLMGGTPAVWNTAMMFFQAMLLAGYLYAHLLSRLKSLRWQVLVHAGILAVGLLFLPVRVAWQETAVASIHPVPWLVGLLAVSIGAPFFAISATAPLLQRWFSHSDHSRASDPYFLYASSNAGGLIALLAYPVLIEPWLGLALQGRAWTAGYLVLAIAVVLCSISLWVPRRRRTAQDEEGEKVRGLEGENIRPSQLLNFLPSSVPWSRRARWVALAFVPSALLLAVTQHISTDVASVPFLWVAPLSLYLLSFIIVFARRPILPHRWMLWLQVWIYALLAVFFTENDLWLLLTLHLLALFVTAMVCHGELVRHRPAAEHLTEFYVWMSVGGLLGGVFCSLIAPAVFDSVLEYPLILILACLLRPAVGRGRFLRPRRRRGEGVPPLRPAGILPAIRGRDALDAKEQRQGVANASVRVGEPHDALATNIAERLWRRHGRLLLDLALPAVLIASYLLIWEHLDIYALGKTGPILFYGATAVALYSFHNRPLRLTLGFAAILAIVIHYDDIRHRIYRERSFFGVYTVCTDKAGYQHKLYSGNILHGDQCMDPNDLCTPRTYYNYQGPLGQVFIAMTSLRKPDHVGVIGLGAGTTACYCEPGQTMTFFEVDPVIERIARNPKLFRYLELCGQDVRVVIGDGRQGLGRVPDKTFDLLVLDAFSSDAIPVHMLTREALALYLRKLAPGGIVLLHISNRYLELEPVVAALAADADLPALIQEYDPSHEDSLAGGSASTWVAVARDPNDLGPLEWDDRWRALEPDPAVGLWTDDYSNILRTLIPLRSLHRD